MKSEPHFLASDMVVPNLHLITPKIEISEFCPCKKLKIFGTLPIKSEMCEQAYSNKEICNLLNEADLCVGRMGAHIDLINELCVAISIDEESEDDGHSMMVAENREKHENEVPSMMAAENGDEHGDDAPSMMTVKNRNEHGNERAD